MQKTVRIKVEALKQKMMLSLAIHGLPKQDVEVLVEPYLEAEFSGKLTHGLSKFLHHHKIIIKTKRTKPKILKDKFNYALIDGKKEMGHTTALFAIDLLLKKAKKYDNAIVAMKNTYWYAMTGTYAKKIAEAGFISLVINNGGPASVAPYGGFDPLFGTNPIAIGIPTVKGPLLLDMATSERPWGEVTLAKYEKREVQTETFYDKNGKFTTDPHEVRAIKSFGEHRGAGLNFMFEILTGAFVTAKMGLQSKDPYDLGYLFFAFSPEIFTTRQKFNKEVRQLIQEVKTSKKLKGVKEIYLPGEQSNFHLQKVLKSKVVEIDKNKLNELERLLS